MTARAPHHAPYWCEENAWHLCVDPRLRDDVGVVMISNPARCVALWHQRAAAGAAEPVLWDYHVIVVDRDDAGEVRAWDLDTTLDFGVPLSRYLGQTFRPVAPPLAPRFRTVPADRYRAEFASDRRHMRDAAGAWQQPPPPWPCIGSGHVLDALLDLDDPRFGAWRSLADFVAAQPRSP